MRRSPHVDSPNILFVFADQMRAAATGFAGNPQVATPHLDALAAQGTVATTAVANCPVCTPYRASLLTGRYPLSTGLFVNDVRLGTDEVTLAHVLGRRGYETSYVGKWHLDGPRRGGFTPPGPRRQGFDDLWAVADCTHSYLHSLYYRDEPRPLYWDGYDAAAQTAFVIEHLRRRRTDRPFCLFLSWGPPHNPYNKVPPAYLDRYDPAALTLRPNATLDRRKDLAGYYAHVTALDDQIGRLTAALDELGLAEDTLVVFTSDHGDMLGSHGVQRKQWPWDESVLVPFVLRWPGRVPAGRRFDAPFNVVDIMPTLLRLAGADAPDRVEGTDFSQTFLGRPQATPESAYLCSIVAFGEAHRFGQPWRGVRTATHTYVRRMDGPWLLYDNRADPYQMNNLAADPAAADLRRRLDADLDRWLRRTHDSFEPEDVYLRRYGIEMGPGRHPVYTNDPEPWPAQT